MRFTGYHLKEANALRHVAEAEGVVIREVKPNHTSQRCPRCGHIGKGNRRGYAYFQCVRRGYEADKDGVESLNIAERAGATFRSGSQTQFPLGNASVSRHVLRDEGVERWHQTTPELQATNKFVGNDMKLMVDR